MGEDGRIGELVANLHQIYTADVVKQILDTMRLPKRVGIWLNPLLEATDVAVQGCLEQYAARPIVGLDGMWSVAASEREALMRDPLVVAGVLYPMNPASVWAAAALEAQAEEEILDLAAAPGGKTLQLAAAMGNTGRLAAVESVPARFHRMRANLDRTGVRNVQCYLDDGRSTGRKVGERFDRVLLDAPCSSDTRIRLDDPKSYQHWSKRKVAEAARKQKRLLRSAFTALRPGGHLLYATCAFSVAENEAVVAHLMRREAAARVVALPAPPAPHQRGRDLPEAVRLLPDDLWGGFFVCRLRKTAD